MTVTLELELDEQVVGPSYSDPFARTLEVRWKVVSHDMPPPSELPDGIDRVIHSIHPIMFALTHTAPTIGWVES